MKNKSPMFYFIWGLVLLLIILHQDVWNWYSDYLVLGFVPIGLFYHACLSVAAAVVWYLATIFAWPGELVKETLKETKGETGEKA